MRKTILAAIITLAAASVAMASPDVSVKDSSVQKIERDISMMFKKSVENRDSSGKRKSKSTSTGSDSTQSHSNRSSETEGMNNSADVNLSLDVLFASKILQLEETTLPYSTCKLLSRPKLPADFGITAEMAPGAIDSIKSQFLSSYASSNGAIDSLADVANIRSYRDCMADYGATIGQAYLYLSSDVQELGATGQSIKNMGYDDFVSIAEAALDKAVSGGIQSKSIKKLHNQAVGYHSTCFFEANITTIKCGSTVSTIASKPTLAVAGIQMYGNAFAGFQGSFRVSRSWSLSEAVEKMKSVSKYAKFASEVSQYAESMESQGKSKEAAAARKKAVELSTGGDRSIGMGGMMPNIHQ